jgi:large subunit ribosomal protein L34e
VSNLGGGGEAMRVRGVRECDSTRTSVMPDARVTLRRKSPYCTRSNRFKKIRTPGGKLTIQYLKKRGSIPKCGDTGAPLFGVAVRRPKELMRLSKPKKTVTRCYGGSLSGKAVRNRYVCVDPRAVTFDERTRAASGGAAWLRRPAALLAVLRAARASACRRCPVVGS